MPFDLEPEKLDLKRRTLLQAAGIVRKRWKQCDLGQSGGPRCASGAIKEAASNVHALWEETYRLLEDEVGNVPAWNDREGQTAENVAQTMERVALAPARNIQSVTAE